MNNKMFKDTLVVGLALFCMFFGAGNLIFPPFLGKIVGDQFGFAALGFLITGVGFPFLSILACAQIGGSFEDMAQRVGKVFATLSMVAVSLLIGPIAAIPRTAATTYELGISTMMPSASHLVTVIIYFAIALIFVLKPTKIIDMIGKILTPILLVILIGMIVVGILFPIGELVPTDIEHAFTFAFREGYNTMDALAGAIMASIPIAAVKAKGYTDSKNISKVLILAGLISSIGLGTVYTGLMYLGSQTSVLGNTDYSRIELLIHIAGEVFGPIGILLLGVLTTLACLSTAIVLMIMSANFFTRLSNGKLSYKGVAIILTLVSGVISLLDVDQIIEMVNPILDVIYPVVIVIIAITLMGKWVKDDRVVRATVYVTLGFSFITILNEWLQWSTLTEILMRIPFYEVGFDWVIPALITFTAANIIFKMVPEKTLENN